MSAAEQIVHDFGSDKKRIRRRALKKARKNRPVGTRAEPPVVVFEAEPGSAQADLPPVRIFLGTEPLQYRAERVFLYSVAKHRNPGRRYEVHLMKDLEGYDRDGWATGFTRYRFLIPHLAGGTGRAIYNDVDQVYLADPADLFDRDMGDAAILAIDDKETSVMLMDCEKLAALWGMDGRKPEPGTPKSVHEAGLWGTMPGIWNARDTEYVPGESKLLHFTTLYKQPWQPFPDFYDYDENENAAVWHDLEAEANAAGYLPFTKDAPSAAWREGAEAVAGSREESHVGPVAKLIAATGAKTLLDYCGGGRDRPEWHGVTVTAGGPDDPVEPVDGVVAAHVLERFSEQDIPWLLDDMFRRARGFVYVEAGREAADGAALPPEWWRGQMETMGAMHPGVSWEVHVPEGSGEGGLMATIRALFGGAGDRFSHSAA